MSNPLWESEPFSRGQAWVDLLLLANHKDSFFYKRGVKIDLKRGQLGRSQVELSDRWNWSRKKVNKFLKDLEKEQQIKVDKNSVTQIVTIVNYCKFQSEGTADDPAKVTTKVTAEGTTEAQQKHTYKNVKKEKNVNNNSAGAFSNQPLSPNDYFKCADDVFREYCKRDENTVRLTTKGEALYKAIHSVESRVQPVTVIDEVITFWRELQISEDFKIKKAYDLRRYLLNTVKKRIKDKYAEVDAIREKERRKYPVNSNQPGM